MLHKPIGSVWPDCFWLWESNPLDILPSCCTYFWTFEGMMVTGCLSEIHSLGYSTWGPNTVMGSGIVFQQWHGKVWKWTVWKILSKIILRCFARFAPTPVVIKLNFDYWLPDFLTNHLIATHHTWSWEISVNLTPSITCLSHIVDLPTPTPPSSSGGHNKLPPIPANGFSTNPPQLPFWWPTACGNAQGCLTPPGLEVQRSTSQLDTYGHDMIQWYKWWSKSHQFTKTSPNVTQSFTTFFVSPFRSYQRKVTTRTVLVHYVHDAWRSTWSWGNKTTQLTMTHACCCILGKGMPLEVPPELTFSRPIHTTSKADAVRRTHCIICMKWALS